MLPPDLQSIPYNSADFLFQPASEADVITLVHYAIQHKLQIRVRGASQSENPSIYTDNFDPTNEQPGTNLNLQLNQLRSIDFIDEANFLVTVGAGCNLGYDPFDPSMTSTETNGLLPTLTQHGWIIPNIPAVIHQTVAGMMATGSSGGSLAYSFDECLVAIRIVDGTGTATTYERTGNLDEPFYAIGSSMGLLGIVVSVTIKCLPYLENNNYQSANIVGYQTITSEDECPFDFRGPGGQKPSLQEFFQQTTYARLLWWPYQELRKVVTWYAEPMSQNDEPFVRKGPKPYEPPFPAVIPGLPNWRLPAQVVASVAYWLINNWPGWFDSLTSNYADEFQQAKWDTVKAWIETNFQTYYPELVTYYFSSGTGLQQFWDIWWSALAMDTVEFSNNLFDLNYTDLWIDIAQTQKLIDVLDTHYQKGGITATGTYTVEVSGAKQSDFWLSPSYGYNVIRLNFMTFANGTEPPQTYFTQFWQLLYDNQIDFRPHWGKMLPPPDGPTGAAYLATVYPKWADFMKQRTLMDPNNIFLTNYWKDQLGF